MNDRKKQNKHIHKNQPPKRITNLENNKNSIHDNHYEVKVKYTIDTLIIKKYNYKTLLRKPLLVPNMLTFLKKGH
jgi:hypothetical protein